MPTVELWTPAGKARGEETGAVAEIADDFGLVEGYPVFNLKG